MRYLLRMRAVTELVADRNHLDDPPAGLSGNVAGFTVASFPGARLAVTLRTAAA